jgi:hypothetical protein
MPPPPSTDGPIVLSASVLAGAMIRADARSTETVSGPPVDSSLSAARTCAQRTRSDVQASIWARMGVVQDRAGVEIGVGIVMLRYRMKPDTGLSGWSCVPEERGVGVGDIGESTTT